jgi:hypothetical protein
MTETTSKANAFRQVRIKHSDKPIRARVHFFHGVNAQIGFWNACVDVPLRIERKPLVVSVNVTGLTTDSQTHLEYDLLPGSRKNLEALGVIHPNLARSREAEFVGRLFHDRLSEILYSISLTARQEASGTVGDAIMIV